MSLFPSSSYFERLTELCECILGLIIRRHSYLFISVEFTGEEIAVLLERMCEIEWEEDEDEDGEDEDDDEDDEDDF